MRYMYISYICNIFSVYIHVSTYNMYIWKPHYVKNHLLGILDKIKTQDEGFLFLRGVKNLSENVHKH